MRLHIFCIIFFFLAAPLQGSPTNASAADTERSKPSKDATAFLSSMKEVPPPQARLWKRHWKTVAKQFVMIDDQCTPVAGYNAARDNSVRVSEDKIIEKLLSQINHPIKLGRAQRLKMAKADAAFAHKVLPRLADGAYGQISDCRVVRIINENEMIVEEIRAVDPNALSRRRNADEKMLQGIYGTRFGSEDTDKLYAVRDRVKKIQSRWESTKVRMIGVNTRRLGKGQIYKGPRGGFKIMIFAPSDGGQLVAVSMETLNKGISEAQLADTLVEAGYTADTFTALLQEEIRKSPRGFAPVIRNAVLKGQGLAIGDVDEDEELEFDLSTTFGEDE